MRSLMGSLLSFFSVAVVCCAVGHAKLATIAEMVVADSENENSRQIFSYDLEVDTSGTVHVIYSIPVVGESRDQVIYAHGVVGNLAEQVLATNAPHNADSSWIEVDPLVTGKIHVCYLENQEPNQQLVYRTIQNGVPSTSVVVERGAWHTRMQVNENGDPLFVRQGVTKLRLFELNGSGTWTQREISPTPATATARLAEFVYDRTRRVYHVLYGDNYEVREVYKFKSTERTTGTFHRLWHASSDDGDTWGASMVDDSKTLYEMEYWTSLSLDSEGIPHVSMYKYAEVGQYNTGTGLLFGGLVDGEWDMSVIVGGSDDSRVGMGAGLVLDQQSRWLGVWDSSPDRPIDFSGADGNLACHVSSAGDDWSNKWQLRPFSAEGDIRLRLRDNTAYVLAQGNFRDVKLHLTSFTVPNSATKPGTPNPQYPFDVTVDNTRRPRFQWSSAGNAEWYQVYVTRGRQHYYSKWVQGTTSVRPDFDMASVEYEWWVRAWSSGGGYSDWSIGVLFHVAEDIQANRPDASSPISPSGSTTDGNLEFRWQEVDTAEWYQLYISKLGDWSWPNWVQSATTWSSSTYTFPAGSYKWWVRTWNSSGGFGDWSSGVEFSIALAVTLTSPAGTVNGTLRPEFSWTAIEGREWFRIYVSQGGSGFLDKWVRTTSWTFDQSFQAGDYEWRLGSWNPASQKTEWSSGQAFHVACKAVPQTPSGVPDSLQPTFSWTGVEGVRWYNLQVYSLDTSTDTYEYYTNKWVENATSVKPTTWDMPIGDYRWHVYSLPFTDADGAWSDYVTFAISELDAPTPSSPMNNAVVVGSRPEFSWSAVTGATSYFVAVDRKDPDTGTFSYIAGSEWNDGSTTFVAQWDYLEADYRWHVRAQGAGLSEWSDWAYFTLERE